VPWIFLHGKFLLWFKVITAQNHEILRDRDFNIISENLSCLVAQLLSWVWN